MYENGLLGLLEHACALCNRFCGVFSIHRRNHSRDHETLASILKFPMKQVAAVINHSRVKPSIRTESAFGMERYYSTETVISGIFQYKVNTQGKS